ncbi:MAG TPA: NadS family protein [Gemmatimonadales bacterium]|jgi:putative transcriptional regulator
MRKELFDQLVESVKQMKDIQRGKRKPGRVTTSKALLATDTPDVAALRAHFQLSQAKFAALLGISLDTLQNWEQRRREPHGPAKVLLRVAAIHPEVLLEVSQPKTRRARSVA